MKVHIRYVLNDFEFSMNVEHIFIFTFFFALFNDYAQRSQRWKEKKIKERINK